MPSSREEQATAMSYLWLILLCRWSILLFLIGLGCTIAYGLVTGGISTQYLLYGRRQDNSTYFSPERVQLLVFTIGVALQYLTQAAHTQAGQMPSLPTGTLALLGLSHSIYLGGKSFATFNKPTSDSGGS